MIRVVLVFAGAVLGFWVSAGWLTWRAARRLDEAVAQAEAMSAHPAHRPVPVEDRPDWPPA